MIVLINYSNQKFRKAQKVNSWSGKNIAKFDKVYEYTEADIDKEYRLKYDSIFSVSRGGGLWLWKPYIIKDALQKLNDGDILFYCDSGACFCRNIKKQFLNMKEDIWVSDISLLEKQFSKADAFVVMDCMDREFWETNQIQSTVLVIRKNRITEKLIDEWQKYCEDERVVSLNPNVMGVDNDVTYIANREDQTALSLLCKKWNIVPHRDPTQYGKVPEAYLRMDGMILAPTNHKEKEPLFLILFRSPEVKASIFIKQALLAYLPRKVSLRILKRLRG